MSEIEVSEKAADMIRKFIKNQNGTNTLRIISQACCGKVSLSVTLDEPKETDFTATVKNINFAIDKKLLEKVKQIRFDFIEYDGRSGFQINAGKSQRN